MKTYSGVRAVTPVAAVAKATSKLSNGAMTSQWMLNLIVGKIQQLARCMYLGASDTIAIAKLTNNKSRRGASAKVINSTRRGKKPVTDDMIDHARVGRYIPYVTA